MNTFWKTILYWSVYIYTGFYGNYNMLWAKTKPDEQQFIYFFYPQASYGYNKTLCLAHCSFSLWQMIFVKWKDNSPLSSMWLYIISLWQGCIQLNQFSISHKSYHHAVVETKAYAHIHNKHNCFNQPVCVYWLIMFYIITMYSPHLTKSLNSLHLSPILVVTHVNALLICSFFSGSV